MNNKQKKPKVSFLKPSPPLPTLDKPLAQLDWLAHRCAETIRNENSRGNFLAAINNYYKKFLREAHGYDDQLKTDSRFYLHIHWDYLALYNFHQYLLTLNIAPYTVKSARTPLIKLMRYAIAHKYTRISNFIVPHHTASRTTEIFDAYDAKEMELIKEIIRPAIIFTNQLAALLEKGYTRTGGGQDPRHFRPGKRNKKGTLKSGGWKIWDNVIWYWENIMECKPLLSVEIIDKHCNFYRAMCAHHGGLKKACLKLGFSPWINYELIVPLAIKLAWETGLNPEALFKLKRNCYQQAHPLTGLPYVQYYKERSRGELELHLALFDLDPSNKRYAGVLPLLEKQSEIIRKTIKQILTITEPLVEYAAEADKKYLFLMQRIGPNRDRRVTRIKDADIQTWKNTIQKTFAKYGAGKKIKTLKSLNLSRFRSTMVAKMVRDGIDFFAISATMGHTHLKTTFMYLRSLQLDDEIQRDIGQHLTLIHANMQENKKNPRPYASPKTQKSDGVIYKGVLSDCKNIYVIPEKIKNLLSKKDPWKEGMPCIHYEMCLLCPNVLITQRNLPYLIQHHLEISSFLNDNNDNGAPHVQIYKRKLKILEGIFDEFEKNDMERAREIAECSDEMIDPLTYRGTLNGK